MQLKLMNNFYKYKIFLFLVLLLFFSTHNHAYAQPDIKNERILNLTLDDFDNFKDLLKLENGRKQPAKVKGVFNSALEFDKTSYLDLGSDNSIKNQDAITIEAWIRVNKIKSSQPDTVIVMKGNYIYGLTRDERFSGDIIYAYINKGRNNINIRIEPEKWQHIVFTYDRKLQKNNMKVYLNGVLEGEKHYSDPIRKTQDSLYIAGNGKQNFNGVIDNVNIYERAISEDEVWELFKHGAAIGKVDFDLRTLTTKREYIQKILSNEKDKSNYVTYLASFLLFFILYIILISLKKNLKFNIFENNSIYIIIIIIHAVLLTLQINLYPGERYPGWDYFWGDARTMGKLFSLSHALKNFELPAIVPYTGLGWNLAGDSDHLFGLLNFLVIFFSPANVIYITQIIFLILGGIGAYLLLKLVTEDYFMSFLGGLFYISTPFLISMTYYSSVSNIFYSIPLLLFLLHKVLNDFRPKKLLLFILYSSFVIGSANVYVFIILPPVAFLYSLLVEYFYYDSGFLKSLKKSFILIVLLLLSGSYIIFPLLNNIHTMSSEILSISKALNIQGIKSILSIGSFLDFFYNLIYISMFKPIEGSGALLYVPICFYIIIIVSIIFKKKIFQDISKQLVIIYILLCLALGMFLEGIWFYSPLAPGFFKSSANGILRYQLNLIPFMLLLAGFICLSAIIKMKNLKRKIIIFSIVLASSLLIDFTLFGKYGNSFNVNSSIFWMTFAKGPFFNSSNFVNIRFIENMWLLLPALNFIFIGVLFFFGFLRGNYNNRSVLFLIYSIIISILYISLYNELRLQQIDWQLLTRDSYRMDSYNKRKKCIDELVNRYDPNYRTLYAAKGNFSVSRGADWKLIAETELHVKDKEKALFSYREFDHPYIGIIFNLFSFGFSYSNNYTPISLKAEKSIDAMKLLGLKWVISSDRKLNNDQLIYIGECYSEAGIYGSFHSKSHMHEGGILYVYRLIEPYNIAFLVDSYKKIDLHDSLKLIYKNKERPWVNSVVYLEEDPALGKNNPANNQNSNAVAMDETSKIIKETFNSIDIEAASVADKFLVLSYLFRPYWKAFIDLEETKIFRAYGGLMCIKVPAGEHKIVFKYYPYDLYIGFLITALTFFIPFIIKRFIS